MIIPANLPSRLPLTRIIVGVIANGTTCTTAPSRKIKKLPFELAIIVVPINCEPPKRSEINGYITSIVVNKSFHFSNHFSVFGRIFAANASGAKKTKTIIIACRAAKITKATTAE